MESYVGYIKSPQDALLIFEACRKGKLNRVQRRLTSKERMDISSGSVFAFDEREAGMRRWTDGRTWSPSRVLGSFLTYRELDTKRRPRRQSGSKQTAFSYKQNGLIKQSFSICTANNQKIHLISYYNKSDVMNGRLTRPTNDSRLSSIEIPKGFYPELNPLDIGGGHSASMHYSNINSRNNSIDSSISCSPTILYHQVPPSLSSSSSSSSSPQSTQDYEEYQDTQLLLSPTTPTTTTMWNTAATKPPATTLPAIIQDIAWEKLPCSEDNRQLNALRTQVHI